MVNIQIDKETYKQIYEEEKIYLASVIREEMRAFGRDLLSYERDVTQTYIIDEILNCGYQKGKRIMMDKTFPKPKANGKYSVGEVRLWWEEYQKKVC